MKLAGTNEETIFNLANELLTNKKAYEKMAKAANPYEDGEARLRIPVALTDYFSNRNL